MLKKLLALLAISLCVNPTLVIGQETIDPKQAEKDAALEKEALQLLDAVVIEAQSLRLPENRIRVQLTTADMLWIRDEGRARSLFLQAAAGISEMMRSIDRNDRQYFNLAQTPTQLRQYLLTTAARRDANLAYEMMISTRQLQPEPSGRNFRQQFSESGLEMELLAQIAANDPKLALKNAEEAIDKGQFPRTLAKVIDQLGRTDKESAAKLSDKLTRRLRSDTLLSNQDASGLAIELLRNGPRPTGRPVATSVNGRTGQVLDEAAFKNLLEAVIAGALTASTRTGQAAIPRRGFRTGGGPAAQDPALIAQNSSRSLLIALRSLLPYVERYLPGRAAAVRQKLSEAGMRVDSRQSFNEFNDLIRSGSVDAIVQAAPNAPTQVQSRLYQQAAVKAAREGDIERARQIANDHLQEGQRNQVTQEVERQVALRQVAEGEIEGAQHALSQMRSDRDRVGLLIQMANAAMKKKDQKLASQLLQEARNLVGRRAENYQQLELQLSVARAYVDVDAASGAELLEAGISQLNELLSAAATLSGFEIRIFREGELPIQPNNMLSSIVTRYGDELGRLATIDFGRAQMGADRFQRTEARVIARIALIRRILGGTSIAESEPMFGRGFRGVDRPR
jgi:hypothetical protein